MKLKYLILAAAFAALTAICAQLIIPLGPVQFSLSIIAVFLTGAILPKRYAFLSMVIYILLGAAGAPVFGGFKGGLFIPTGGYIIAYPIMVFIISLFCGIPKKNRMAGMVAGMIIALTVCYAMGSIWLSVATGMTYKKALLVGVTPFILFDLIKVAITAPLSQILYTTLKKAKIL